MKTTGVVFDFYDDATGDVLKSYFPTAESLPEVVKVAHILSPEERSVLRDDAYALVALNGGQVLRKFACVDAGNTLLSALYLDRVKELLPEEAVKLATARIEQAAERFGLLGYPKTASKKGASRTRDPMNQPFVGDQGDWQERTNLTSVSGAQGSGKVMESAAVMKTAGAREKYQAARGFVSRGLDHYNAFKAQHPVATARAVNGAIGAKLALGTVTTYKLNDARKKAQAENKQLRGMMGLHPDAPLPEMPKQASAVDLSEHRAAPALVKRASASRHALEGRYPLDAYEDVLAAVRYFDEHCLELDPLERHDFAVKTAARAAELDIPFGEGLQRYGSTEYAPDVEAHLASRKALAPDFAEVWEAMVEKRASIEPEDFAQLLQLADVRAGLNWYYGGEVADAYFSTFGGWSGAEKLASWSWSQGDSSVTAPQLMVMAEKGLLEQHFESELCGAFKSDPVAIFESLPDAQKHVIAGLTKTAGWVEDEAARMASRIMKTPGAYAGATSAAKKDIMRTLDGSARLGATRTIARAGGQTAALSSPALKPPALPAKPKLASAAAAGGTKMQKFLSGVAEEIGPAVGATLAAGVGKAYGFSPVASAAAGYGLGSMPHLAHDAYKARRARRAGKTVTASAKTAAPWSSVVKPPTPAPMGGMPAPAGAGMAAPKMPAPGAAPKMPSLPKPGTGLGKTAAPDLWNPSSGAVTNMEAGTRAANHGLALAKAPAGAALKKPQFTLDNLRSAYQKQGLKPSLTSALRKA